MTNEKIYAVGWAFILGMLVFESPDTSETGLWAFQAIARMPGPFLTTVIIVWILYTLPCAVVLFVYPRLRKRVSSEE